MIFNPIFMSSLLNFHFHISEFKMRPHKNYVKEMKIIWHLKTTLQRRQIKRNRSEFSNIWIRDLRQNRERRI